MNIFENAIPEEGKIKVTQEDVFAAMSNKVTLSTYLNEKYADKAQYWNGLDAFDAALLSAGIVVKGDVTKGIESSKMEKFFVTEPSNRTLFPEFVNRTIRQSLLETPVTQYLIGETVTITGDTMKQPTLDLGKDSENRKNLRRARVAEAAQIPTTEMKLAETAVSIYKYGRAVKASYEVMRRTTVDLFRKTIELLTQFIDEGEYYEILNVLENGDGNHNAAREYKRSDLNAAGKVGVLDDITLLKFLMVHYPINFDTVIVNQDLYLQLVSSRYDGSLSVGANAFVPFTFPQGIFKGLTVLYNEDVEDKAGHPRMFALNKALGFRKIVEQGSSIQENERYAADQTQKMFITENAGFGKIYEEASAILLVD